MEDYSSGCYILAGDLPGFQDLQMPLQLHHTQNPQVYQHAPISQSEVVHLLPPSVSNGQGPEKCGSFSNHTSSDKGKRTAGHFDEIHHSESNDGQPDGEVGKGSPWQRMKWTAKMVKLMITALSYVGEESSSDCIERKKSSLLQKVGKWRCISRVMVERGYCVSPQQCEDKFNDLNKRYKRLNDLLGRGTSCQVVENPQLLSIMIIPNKAKEEARRILCSKHLFFEEMCSYHNKNRLHLPHDPDLQKCLQLALFGIADSGTHQTWRQSEDNNSLSASGIQANHQCERIDKSAKKLKQIDEAEYPTAGGLWKCLDSSSKFDFSPGNIYTRDFNMTYPEGSKREASQKHQMALHILHLKEQKLQMKSQMLKLRMKQLQWGIISWKQDWELEKMRLENERMRLENQSMAIELKRKEVSAKDK